MKHRAAFQGAVVLLLTLWPAVVQAAGVGQSTPTPATQGPGPTGSIDAQAGSLNGQVVLGRGSASLNASLTDTGPQGQLNLSAPGLFSATASVANDAIDSAATVCFGARQITVAARRGSGLHVSLQPLSGEDSGCTLPSAAQTALSMGPMLGLAQAAADTGSGFTDGVLEAVRRFVVLAVIAGLLWLLVPPVPGSVVAAARSLPWSRFGIGLCLAITIPIVGILIFVIGLPLGIWWMGLLVLAFYACVLAVSFALTGLVIGAWLGDRIPGQQAPRAAVFAVGLIVLSVLGLLPSVGALVNVVAVVYGVGALVLAPRAHLAPARTPLRATAPVEPALAPVVEAPAGVPLAAAPVELPAVEPAPETRSAHGDASDQPLSAR
ncbi:MAG: hypothetical protein JO023_06705 [Chloroflexi bacterium]|nr:hypothetical protein [Chloroflexota bacterium]